MFARSEVVGAALTSRALLLGLGALLEASALVRPAPTRESVRVA